MPSHSSFAIRAASGSLELVTPRLHGGADLWIEGQPFIIFGTPGEVSSAALIESNLGGSTNLHCLYREGTTLAHDWGERPPGIWHGPTVLPGGLTVTGAPAFIEVPDGLVHVIAPTTAGIAHWTGTARATPDFTDLAKPPLLIDWNAPVLFADPSAEAVALLHGSFQNIEAITRTGGDLSHWWQDNATGAWNGPFPAGSGATGQHCWFEGPDGNFEIIAPMASGGLGHWTRDNSDPELPWSGPVQFGEGAVTAVGCAADFEAVAVSAGKLFQYTLQDAVWSGPVQISPDPPDPAVAGASNVPWRAGMVGVHASLLRTGKVLLFGFGDENMEIAESRILNPATGAVSTPAGVVHHGGGHGPASTPHIFCSGHAFLADGRLLVTGGHHLDIKNLNVLDPVLEAWQMAGSMPESRWYPTCCPLPGGRVMTVGGTSGLGGTEQPVNNTLEIYAPSTGLGPQIPVPNPFSAHFDAAHAIMDTYPLVLLLPSGKVWVHSRYSSRFFDPTTNTWDSTDLRTAYAFGRTYPGQGNAILLPLRPEEDYRARILLTGGCGEAFDRLWWGVPAATE
ncbi:MAG: hypothetical protein FJW39_33735, partial [Acidobacteria bacterium]|nr:hypothetical protein [Acidobacteriota bacterium]